MTIEHNTTHGPHGAGQLAADWMLESGHGGRSIGHRTEVADKIRLAVPYHDMALTLDSAAALKDALVVHLRNMGWDDPDTRPEPAPEPVQGLRAKLAAPPFAVTIANPWIAEAAPEEVAKVAQTIKDAYANNSRTIGAAEAGQMYDAEAVDVLEGLTEAEDLPPGVLVDRDGIRYTSAAVDVLKHKAIKYVEEAIKYVEEALKSPVANISGWVTSKAVRKWTDTQARGAWNHAMEDPRTERLTDRPTGRAYSPMGGDALRARLNEINGADAARV